MYIIHGNDDFCKNTGRKLRVCVKISALHNFGGLYDIIVIGIVRNKQKSRPSGRLFRLAGSQAHRTCEFAVRLWDKRQRCGKVGRQFAECLFAACDVLQFDFA